jgi:AAHS family 4-hydroxybenzoate transporter-like MFS transporter
MLATPVSRCQDAGASELAVRAPSIPIAFKITYSERERYFGVGTTIRNPMLSPQPAAPRVEYHSDVAALIDAAPIGRFQREIFLLCFLIAMLDGFDTQSMAFIAPSLAAEWRVATASFGPIFSATLLGSMLGVAVIGRLADRYGRRGFTVGTVALFGVATLASAWAESLTGLLIWRLIAGFGLGGALPNFMALAAEYAPRRLTSTIVVITMWGFPLGAVLGGLLSTVLIAHFGWRAVLIAGGVAPLLLVPVLIARLPESVRFLAMRPEGQEAARRALRRIDPARHLDATTRLTVSEDTRTAGGYRLLFARGRAANTILFATAMFMSLLLSYLLLSWIPLLLRDFGLSVRDAVLGAVTFNLAGILGSYVFIRVVEGSSRPLGPMIATYCASAFAVTAIGAVGAHFLPVMTSIFVAGFLLVGTQMTLSAFIASSYPTTLRATAIGCVQAVGRCGSLIGPLVAGGLMSLGMAAAQLLALSSIAALFAAAALALLALTHSRGDYP